MVRIRKHKIRPLQEFFPLALLGLIMIISAFVNWGRWVVFILGVLFLVSALRGVCISCMWKKIFGDK